MSEEWTRADTKGSIPDYQSVFKKSYQAGAGSRSCFGGGYRPLQISKISRYD